MHAAAFQEQYEGVTAFSTAGRGDASGYDPAELVRAAIAELDGDPELLRQERERARWLFVDEYQDTDPAQVELLELLAGGGGNLVAVGDPDQAIYAFRGAEPRGIVEFPDRFRHTDGRPAGRVSLGVCRRSGEELLPDQPPGRRGAARARGSTAGWSPATAPSRARPRCTSSPPRRSRRPTSPTSCAGRTCSTACPWSQMAVVVRTAGGARAAAPRAGLGRRAGRGLRRRPAAGRPAGRRAAAQRAHRAAAGVRRRAGGRGRRGRARRAGRRGAARLARSGGATVLDLRRLRRAVRIALAKQGIDAAERGAPLATRAGRRHPARGAARPRRPPARRVAAVLAAGRLALAHDGTAEDVLWAMWQRSGLAGRWARASAAGGPSGAVADRDLDAVVALFDAAAGFVDRLPSADVAGVRRPPLRPGAARRHRRGPGGGGARRSGCSPRTRPRAWSGTSSASPASRRASGPTCASGPPLLGTEELVERASGIDGTGVDRRTLALAEERRLFYVACTRARRRLVVTAVEGALDGADAGATASRFLDLVVPPPEDGRPLTELPRSLTLPALVADLRRALTDPQTPAAPPVGRRLGAAPAGRRGRRRGGADRAGGGWPRCPTTPRSCRRRTPCGCARRPSRPSSAARCAGCSARSAPRRRPDTTRTVGTAVHAVAQQVADGLPPAEAPAALAAELDQLDLGPGWSDQRQRQSAQDMLDRFLALARGRTGAS